MFGDEKRLHFKFSVKFDHDTPEVFRIGNTEKESVDRIKPDDSTEKLENSLIYSLGIGFKDCFVLLLVLIE